jgi:hypothetical protein
VLSERQRAWEQTRFAQTGHVRIVRVRIRIPPMPLPPLKGRGTWVLRASRVTVGGESLNLSNLSGRDFPVVQRPPPGPVRPPGKLYDACEQGDLKAVRRILSPGACFPSSYSTEETDEVSAVMVLYARFYTGSVVNALVYFYF